MSSFVRSDGDPPRDPRRFAVPLAELKPAYSRHPRRWQESPMPAVVPDDGLPKSQILTAAGFVLPPTLIIPADAKADNVCPTCGQAKPIPRANPYAYEWYAFVRTSPELQEFYNEQLGVPWTDDRSRDDPKSRYRRERGIAVETAERYEALPPADIWPAGSHGSQDL